MGRSERAGRLVGFGVLLLLTLFPWAFLTAPARAQDCGAAIAPPVVSVRTQARPPVQDLSRGIANLTGDPRLAVPHGLQDFKFAVGVTAADATGTSQWQMQGFGMGDGRQCWSITQLQIVITVFTKVYIAKEVPRGSCLWNEVAKHEAKHVRLDQKLFPHMSGMIRPKVLRAISRSVPARSGEEAKALLGQLVNQAVGEAVRDFEVTRNAEQLKIDTRAEYSHPNRVCGEAEVAAAIQRAGLR